MRKFIAAAIALAIVLKISPSQADTAICGDVNRSGALTATDALSVLKAAVGQEQKLYCPPPAALQQTRQSLCFDESGSLQNCVNSGQDGDLRKGLLRSYTDNGDGTTTDNNTGLMWENLDASNLPEVDAIHSYGKTYTWKNAFGKAAELNSVAFAGYSDWRVPNVTELLSLVDYQAGNSFYPAPSIYPMFDNCERGCGSTNCSCTALGSYWTSTFFEDRKTEAWFVNFETGISGHTDKTTSRYVRVVRGGL